MKVEIIMISLIVIVFIIAIAYMITSAVKDSKNKSKIIKGISEEEHEKIKSYLDNIEGLNKKRNNHKILFIIELILILVLLYLFSMLFILTMNRHIYLIFIVLAIILLFIAINIDEKIAKEYRKTYKELVIKNVIKEIDSNFKYSPSLGMKQQMYDEIGLDSYDYFNSEDLIEGKVENLDLTMSEIFTQKRVTDSDGKTTYEVSFSGLTACINLKKQITKEIYIIPNYSSSNRKRVLMDNEKFNKKFVVYSDDSITTLRILTPDVLCEIMDFYDKTLIDIEISIQNNNLYVMLYSGGLFEPSMKNEEQEIQNVYLNKCVFNSIQKIVKELVKVLNDLEV